MEIVVYICQELTDGDESLSTIFSFYVEGFLWIDSGYLIYIVVGGSLVILEKGV